MISDVYAQRLVRFFYRPRYKIEGGCKKRGACCQFIHMDWPQKKLSFLMKLRVFWTTEVLGFYFRDFEFMEDKVLTKVMSCRYLKKDGRCKHYFLRPQICRDWPKRPYFKKPVLLKGCGFKAIPRK
jgi:Fe-S-cluster containining protein